MKRISILFIIVLLFGSLFFATSEAAAGPTAKPTKKPKKTEQAVAATQRADAKATREAAHPKGKKENFKGTIESVSADSLTLKLDDGSLVTFGLLAETRIKIPGVKDGLLQAGLSARVQAQRDENDALIAISVMAVPGKPTKVHRVGWVTDYQLGVSISILAHDGETYTFLLIEETKILPEERAEELTIGSRVTLIAPRDLSSVDPIAVGIVVHPEGSGEGSLPGETTEE